MTALMSAVPDMMKLLSGGKTLKAIQGGDADPQQFIPMLIVIFSGDQRHGLFRALERRCISIAVEIHRQPEGIVIRHIRVSWRHREDDGRQAIEAVNAERVQNHQA